MDSFKTWGLDPNLGSASSHPQEPSIEITIPDVCYNFLKNDLFSYRNSKRIIKLEVAKCTEIFENAA